VNFPAAELSAGYTFVCDFSGWYVSGAANVNQWFGIVAKGTGSHRNNFDVTINTARAVWGVSAEDDRTSKAVRSAPPALL
jgi:hypothetical protein